MSAHHARRACIARLKVVRASTCPTLRASLWEACSLASVSSELALVATCFTRRGLGNTRWFEWPNLAKKYINKEDQRPSFSFFFRSKNNFLFLQLSLLSFSSWRTKSKPKWLRGPRRQRRRAVCFWRRTPVHAGA